MPEWLVVAAPGTIAGTFAIVPAWVPHGRKMVVLKEAVRWRVRFVQISSIFSESSCLYSVILIFNSTSRINPTYNNALLSSYAIL